MLQVDLFYEILYQNLFNDFACYHFKNGVINPSLGNKNIKVFTPKLDTDTKIFFYDQEPFIPEVINHYVDLFMTLEAKNTVLVTSERSPMVDSTKFTNKFYYFFHGFAALDWYRGHYALNYNKQVIKNYKNDFISFNRIINYDRSYRIYFVSRLVELGLINKGKVSFNVTDNLFDDWCDEVSNNKTKLSEHARRHAEQHLTGINKLSIDGTDLPGSVSADIPRDIKGYWPNNDLPDVDAFWHIVTETVFYYDKLHLTEKIFKPIVSKQPFMLLAAPGNLEYLRSYGFKTFEGIIDESYDSIKDNDARIDAVVAQLKWYCELDDSDKFEIQRLIHPIVEYNFNHFYTNFRKIITDELITNAKNLFNDIGCVPYTDFDQFRTLILQH